MSWFDDENFYGPFQLSAEPKPTFLPLMRRPCAPVEKSHADYMRALLERTCAELRIKNNG